MPRKARDVAETTFKRMKCMGCGFMYEEALGLPDQGIAAGTRWTDLPDDWVCPNCRVPRELVPRWW
ncbi:rubredoxin [Mycobacterium sp. MAA66]|uniref:rubredoxin n=1 Tax=Mycobacterium sp. MAA66 TaxID=3156297 RepID=UPI0035189121